MYRILLLCPVMVAVFMSFPTAVALTAGAPLVQAILDVLPAWVTGGLSVAGKLLPGLGIAMLLHYMPAKKYFNYILIGFVVSVLKGSVLGVALLGTAWRTSSTRTMRRERQLDLQEDWKMNREPVLTKRIV